MRRETVRIKDVFGRKRATYKHSFAYFRAMTMITVLQRDIGLYYDPALKSEPALLPPGAVDEFFLDSRNVFIHGVIQTKKGTCASFPPLYAAVGRRLGYPLKFARTKSHRFLRWDDPAKNQCFNIECTCRGLVSHNDEYYRRWPFPSTYDEVRRYGF